MLNSSILSSLAEYSDEILYRYEYEPERRFAFVSKASSRIVGYTPDEHYADPDLGRLYIYPDDLRIIERALQTRQIPRLLEQRWKHRDGHLVWVEQLNIPIIDDAGRLVAIEGSIRDISTRKQAEAVKDGLLKETLRAYEDLQTAELRLSYLASITSQLAASLDYETTLQSVASLAVPQVADWCVVDMLANSDSLEIVAVSHVETVKLDAIRRLRERYPPNRDAEHGLWQVLRSGKAEIFPEVEPGWRALVARDEEHLRLMELLAVRSSICVPLLAHGRVLGALTLFYSESGRAYTEDDLEFAQDVANRCAMAIENAQLYQQAQEALQTRQAFVDAIVHDLKNPLTSIHGLSRFLRRTLERADWDKEKFDEIAEGLIDGSDRMLTLLNEILDAARMDAGQAIQLQKSRTDLLELVARLRSMSPRISVESDSQQILVNLDAQRVYRVLANLVDNALKYSPSDSVVRVMVKKQRRHAVVEIRDRGIGIPRDDIPRIFERFFRSPAASEKAPGSGLGLWGARLIVEAHGGSIDIQSTDGKGTKAIVRLPLPSESLS